jgi:hypothetical protein
MTDEKRFFISLALLSKVATLPFDLYAVSFQQLAQTFLDAPLSNDESACI